MNRPRRATVLVNPAARGISRGFDGTRMVRYLAARGVDATLGTPASGPEATRAAADAAGRGDDILFVVGGDGSVRDAAHGLAGSNTALAAIPAGTVNIWATEAGIPRGLRAAVDCHLQGQAVRMDLGMADGKRFLLMAGIGWDAEIAWRVPDWLKRHFGDLAYLAEAAWMLPRLRPRQVRWTVGQELFEQSLAWMVLGNTRLYGGRIEMTPNATIDDGQLDIVALCPTNLAEGARLAGRLSIRRFRSDPRVVERRSQGVCIETPGLAVQLDGDFAGETPMTFSTDPGALLVSVPAGPLPRLFGRPHTNRGRELDLAEP